MHFPFQKDKMRDVSQKSQGNFQKALSMLMSDNVLFEMNWQGFKGKHKMSDMYIFQKLIYEEWFTHTDYDDYIVQLKVMTKKAHKRYSKNQERRRNRANASSSEQIQTAVKAIAKLD